MVKPQDAKGKASVDGVICERGRQWHEMDLMPGAFY